MSSSSVEDAINVYTDGSWLPAAGRRGGAGLRIVIINAEGNEDYTDVPLLGVKGTTNNEMELYACKAGIEEAARHPSSSSFTKIVIQTDSRYVVDNYPRARYWAAQGWRNSSGKPVLNARLWKDILKAVRDSGKRVEFRWVKGHAKDQHNRAVDKLAKSSARSAVLAPLSRSTVRRKTSEKSVELGSVVLSNQRLSIRVITDQYLELPRCFKYKYEVLTKRSPYFGNVDIAYSNEVLAAGHHYYVLMNSDPKNPRIRKKLRELPRS